MTINRLLTFTKLVSIFINVHPVCFQPISDLSVKFDIYCLFKILDESILQFFFRLSDDLWEFLEKRITKRHRA